MRADEESSSDPIFAAESNEGNELPEIADPRPPKLGSLPGLTGY